MYRICNNADGVAYSVMRLEDQSIMRLGDDNDSIDYQEYLAWLAEGNEPLPADGPE